MDSPQAALLIDKGKTIGRLLGGVIAKADLFCGELPKAVREPLAEYFVNPIDSANR